ncbi:hypothetical protein FSW04_09150 [Baekduia soli]|uniref:Glycoside hydrolase family 42 N-terminal domain-containing protein n=1 Tax=Baekduia soli TaxID=496014 RepID=A0A5B8U3V2_9ACTN|nr:hypothetical protein [Baekduia soli]QEC47724.1 hypothetical protein FSW04_09150 [Baekduia soli]
MTRLRGLLVAGLLLASFVVAAPAGALVVGIGDQKPDMFADPRFAAMQIRYARIAVSWDVLQNAWERDALDQWLGAARAAGVTPLVGFTHARGDRRRVLPTPSATSTSSACSGRATRG